MPSKSWSIGSADACRKRGRICTYTRCVAWDTCFLTQRAVPDRQDSSASPNRERASPSLWLRLIIGLVSVSLLAVATASGVLYVRFKAKNTQFREQTLSVQASVIANYLKEAPEGPIQLPNYVIEDFKANNGRFAVVARGRHAVGCFVRRHRTADRDQPVASSATFSCSSRTGINSRITGFPSGRSSATSQCGSKSRSTRAISSSTACLEEFVQDIAWIWVPFVIILLLVNLLVARIGLAPLRMAANQAAAIGPGAVSMRLTEDGLPRDVHALVCAVNRGLDRLETAFDAQRRFIADAAHELRTPVAVLKAHAGILSKFEGHAELLDEISSLERLVNQLLDIARLDVLQLDAENVAD